MAPSAFSVSSLVVAFAAVALVATIACTHAQRTTVNFDFSWRHHLGDVPGDKPSDVCPPSAFPRNMSGVECLGLQNSGGGDASPDDCRGECCLDGNCAVWQWESPSVQGGGCWIGSDDDCNHPNPSWIGGARDVPAPSPPPPAAGARMNLSDSNWTVVDTPHDFIITGAYNESTPGIGHSYLPRNVSWYRKHFVLPEEWKGSAIWLYFEGAFRYATVYVNEQYLGKHMSGYTSFAIRLDNITQLNYGASKQNLVAVFVDAMDGSGWWYEGGGIYRHVHLVKTGLLHIEPDGIATYANVTGKISSGSTPADGHNADSTFHAKATVRNHQSSSATFTCKFILYDKEGTIAGSASSSSMSLQAGQEIDCSTKINVQNAKLWSIPRPYLYRLTTQVMQGDDITDNVTLAVGIHDAKWTSDNGLYLNGKHVKVRGFCDHNDFEGVGMAVPDRINLFRAQGVRGLGGNGWRMSHNPPIPALLDILDRVGIVVMDENRLFDNNTQYITAMGNLVKRDRNHASVVIWSFCNEAGCEGSHEDGAPSFRAITYALDGSRPVLANMFSYGDLLSNNTDVQGFSHRPGTQFDQFHAQFPKKPSFGSECCSCTTMRGEDVQNDTIKALSNFNADCVSQQTNWTNGREFVVGSMVWTAFDYYGEPAYNGYPHKSSSFGSYDLSGFSKAAAYWYRSWWLANVSTTSDDRAPVGKLDFVHIVQSWDKPAGGVHHESVVQNCMSPGTGAQTFNFESNGTLRNAATGLCLSAACDNSTSGCYPLTFVDCSGSDVVWSYDKSAQQLKSKSSGLCLDVYADSGPQVGLYACHSAGNQQWEFSNAQVKSVGLGSCLTDSGASHVVDVYSSAPNVTVYLDGNFVDTQSLNALGWATFGVPFKAGNLTAVGFDASRHAVASHSRFTSGKAASIRLSIDAPSQDTGTGAALLLDGQDVAMLRAEILDSNGNVVHDATNNVTFEIVSGPGRVIAAGNGDPRCHEPNHAPWRSAYHGLVRGFVQVNEFCSDDDMMRQLILSIDADQQPRTKIVAPGDSCSNDAIVVKATSPGISGGTVSIPTSVTTSRDSVLAAAEASIDKIYLK